MAADLASNIAAQGQPIFDDAIAMRTEVDDLDPDRRSGGAIDKPGA